MRTIYGWKFMLTIALPLLLASLSVTLLTFELIGRVSTGANIEDRQRTTEIVKSALAAAQKQLSNIATDNAYWDDAARNAYGAVDEAWVDETWGVSSESGVNYDLIMVVDRQKPQPVSGYRWGKPYSPKIKDYYSGKLDNLLDILPQTMVTADAMATTLNTPDGMAVVAAAPIIATSDDLKISSTQPRYLVLVKFLTPEYLAAIGDQYVIKDLRLNTGAVPGEGEPVLDVSGVPVATLLWSDRRPGDIARAAVMSKAVPTLGFMALVMLGIGLLCWRMVRHIARREAVARHDALHDSLTGLPNRTALFGGIEDLAKRTDVPVVVAFADLDGFKEVNDTYDHATGDRLIRAVSAGLSHLADGRGTVYRLGGDEFVLLFSGPDAQEAARSTAERFIDFLRVPFDFEGRQASVGASIGIAGSGVGPLDANELMRRADIAMYRAKSGGKNRCCAYSPEFDIERVDNNAIALELRDIISRRTIAINYQPVVDARTRGIVSVEALARWPSDSPRKIGPDRFIRVAEASGLIDDFGDLILAKACQDAANWPGLRLSVNISPVQLKNPAFVQKTLRTIAESGIDPRRVELEITEGTLVEDVAKAKQIFQVLQNAGVRIALDDFGTGFSSIGYLRQFNFDRIKIDKSLIDQILSGSAEQHIVQGTMLMASGLTAAVTAEGVEREEQIDVLRLTGCREMQGYFFFRPMSAEALTEIMAEPRFAIAV